MTDATYVSIGSPQVGVSVTVVRLKAGFVGQVLVGYEIVHETEPRNLANQAEGEAVDHVVERLTEVFGAR